MLMYPPLQGLVMVLLEAHQGVSARFQTFKAFRAEIAASHARPLRAVAQGDGAATGLGGGCWALFLMG